MTCPACGRELERCPFDFQGMPAYFQCECGYFTTSQKEYLKEEICRTIPYLREQGPI